MSDKPAPLPTPEDVARAFDAFKEALRPLFDAFTLMAEWYASLPEELRAAIEASTTEDAGVFDDTPDWCWRCDAVDAENDLGTCADCFADLRGLRVS